MCATKAVCWKLSPWSHNMEKWSLVGDVWVVKTEQHQTDRCWSRRLRVGLLKSLGLCPLALSCPLGLSSLQSHKLNMFLIIKNDPIWAGKWWCTPYYPCTLEEGACWYLPIQSQPGLHKRVPVDGCRVRPCFKHRNKTKELLSLWYAVTVAWTG